MMCVEISVCLYAALGWPDLVDREKVSERLGEVVQLVSTGQDSGHGDVSELR